MDADSKPCPICGETIKAVSLEMPILHERFGSICCKKRTRNGETTLLRQSQRLSIALASLFRFAAGADCRGTSFEHSLLATNFLCLLWVPCGVWACLPYLLFEKPKYPLHNHNAANQARTWLALENTRNLGVVLAELLGLKEDVETKPSATSVWEKTDGDLTLWLQWHWYDQSHPV